LEKNAQGEREPRFEYRKAAIQNKKSAFPENPEDAFFGEAKTPFREPRFCGLVSDLHSRKSGNSNRFPIPGFRCASSEMRGWLKICQAKEAGVSANC